MLSVVGDGLFIDGLRLEWADQLATCDTKQAGFHII